MTESDANNVEATTADPVTNAGMSWYVLRVASNKEEKVRDTLMRKVSIEDGFANRN